MFKIVVAPDVERIFLWPDHFGSSSTGDSIKGLVLYLLTQARQTSTMQ